MEYIICILVSVAISSVFTLKINKMTVSTILEADRKSHEYACKHVSDMCIMTFNSILKILRKRGLIDDSVKDVSLEEGETDEKD